MDWAKSMPFTSINPINPWNFGGNCSAFGDVEKLSFFESAILNLKRKKKFASSPRKLVTNYVLEWIGLNFSIDYAGLQPNMNAGMIKEHECIISDFHELFDQLKHVLNV